MQKHAVTYQPSGKMVHVPQGTTLFNAAHWAGLPIDSTCGGRGTCGKCGVRVLSGHADRTLADYRHLSDKLDEGWRLSCQAIITEDTECEVPRLMRSPKAATMGQYQLEVLCLIYVDSPTSPHGVINAASGLIFKALCNGDQD